jgi:enoyl-CoA hydratase/carnithine racemase
MTVTVAHPAPHVAELIMDRPEALNALSTDQALALTQACAEVADRSDIGAVILASALERSFCVGADLKERQTFDDHDFAAQRPIFVSAFAALRDLEMPTIAAVEGFALGGGCELALSCDLIIASETAVFGLPETRLGLVPGGGGTQLLARRVGINRALEMIFTGRRLDAAEAQRVGIVDRLVPPGRARDEAHGLATEIVVQSPVSLRAAKRAIRRGYDLGLSDGLLLEDEAWRAAAYSTDRVEGIDAFITHRTPQWPSWPASGGP